MGARPAGHMIFILITILIDVMGIGLIVPVLPLLVKELSGSETTSAYYIGILTATYAAMQFIFAPILGSLSDRYGRRPVLLVSLAGMALDYILLFFAPNLWWLFIGRLIAGITGASVTVANAYVADITPPQERSKAFGWLGAMFGLGFILGPALGGWLGEHHLRMPFLAAAALSGINFLYGFFILPESLPKSARIAQTKPSFNPLAALKSFLEYPLLRSLIIVFILLGLASQIIINTWVLFTEEALHWTPSQNGTALAFYGVLVAMMRAWLISPMIRYLGERWTILIGLSAAIVEFGILTFARSNPVVYASLVIGALSGIADPTVQAIISRQVNETEQGKVMGAITSLNSLVGIAGPLIATSVFAYGVSVQFSGMAFALGMILSILGTLIIMSVLKRILPQG